MKLIFLLNRKKKRSLLKIKLKMSISRGTKRHYRIIYTVQADRKKKKKELKNLALSQGVQMQFCAGMYITKIFLHSGCSSMFLAFTPGKL